MMTARPLLPFDATKAGAAPPPHFNSSSTKSASRPADFLKFMGQAQARQTRMPDGGSMLRQTHPTPSERSDPSHRLGQSDRPNWSYPSPVSPASTPSTSSIPTGPPPATVETASSGLLLSMLPQVPKEEISLSKEVSSLQNVLPAGVDTPGFLSATSGSAIGQPAKRSLAPLLSPNEPATTKPSDKPVNPAPNADPVASPSRIAGLDMLAPIVQPAVLVAQAITDQTAIPNPQSPIVQAAQPEAEMTTVGDIAPLLSPNEPATTKPSDKPVNPAPNADPVASPSKIAGLDTSLPLAQPALFVAQATTDQSAILNPQSAIAQLAPPETEVTAVEDLVPLPSPNEPATTNPSDKPVTTAPNTDSVVSAPKIAGFDTSLPLAQPALFVAQATTDQSAIRNPQSAIAQPAPIEVEVAAVEDLVPLPSPNEPAITKPSDKPANPAPNADPVASPSKLAGLDASLPIVRTALFVAQATTDQSAIRNPQSAIAPPIPPSGTTVAINGQRMKSASQANEIAGSAAQKLPPSLQTASEAPGADEAIPAVRASIPVDFSDLRQSTGQWMILDSTAPMAAVPTLTANIAGASMPSAARIEQVEHLISREVVTIRQSGADALAVSLKVDSRTSLFLQLTNHQGRIEASVRCESGDAGALDAHWKQLQESLARQNVQLLPRQDKPLPVGPSSDAQAETPGNFQDGPSAGQQPPRPPAPPVEKPSEDAMNAAIGLSKPKPKPRRHPGWESWA